MAADVDEVELYKKVAGFNKVRRISVAHNHPEGDFTIGYKFEM